MRKTRAYVLTLALAVGTALASSSPSVPTSSGSSGIVDLGAAAGLAQALSGSSHGRMNRMGLQQASTAAAEAASVAGLEGADRSVIGIGDVNLDGKADLLDLRANNTTLTVSGVSGHRGATLWSQQYTGTSTIYGAAFPAAIDAEGGDAYLLVQWAHEGFLNWSVYAIDGTSGAVRWTQSGQLLSGVPTIPPSPPSVPPSLPPLPPVPTAAPTALPTALPTGVPSALPTAVPTAVPSALPTTPPTGVPSALPTTLPTTVPTTVPTALPTTLPTSTSAPAALPGAPSIPSMVPPASSSSDGGRMTPASNENDDDGDEPKAQVIPSTLEAFTLGLKPTDVDGDDRSDFALVALETGTALDQIPVMAATLVTLSANGGSAIGVIAGVGRGTAPHVGIAGDMTADGNPDLIASNEVMEPGSNFAATTWLASASNGRPLWAALDQFDVGSVAVVDAHSDVTGDQTADLVVHRIPEAGGGRNAAIVVRGGTNGSLAWRTELPETSVVTVGPRIDADEAADIVTQAIVGASPDAIPTKVTYKALSGANAAELYVSDFAFPCAGCAGTWTATLTGNAGDLDADGANDLTHSIGAYPSTASSASSQAGVNIRNGQALWTNDCACAPATPVQANLAAGPGQDLIEAREVVTTLTDSISLRAASGTDAKSLWQTSVVVGNGNDRIRSIALTPADLTGPGADPTAPRTSDVLITAVQRSGSVWRSVVIAVRGSTGRVIWIRTR